MSCLFISIGKLLDIPADEVRASVCDFMESNLDTSYQDMAIEEWIKWQLDSNPSEYIRTMRGASTWGGAMEISMCTLLYTCDIRVYDVFNPDKIVAEFVRSDFHSAPRQLRISWSGSHYEPIVY